MDKGFYRNWRVGTAVLLLVTLLLGAFSTDKVQAFTLQPVQWSSPNATYNLDSSYTNQGSGWAGKADTAAADWTAHTVFYFTNNSASQSQIRASNLDCSSGTLAITTPYISGLTGYIYKFDMQVNVQCGYPYWDGTQAPTIPPNYYDLASLVRHELGHGAGLCHSSNNSLLMGPSQATGVIYPMDYDAQNGVAYRYAGQTSTPPEGGCIG